MEADAYSETVNSLNVTLVPKLYRLTAPTISEPRFFFCIFLI